MIKEYWIVLVVICFFNCSVFGQKWQTYCDTIEDVSKIKEYYITNPSTMFKYKRQICEERTLLKKLINLETLYLEGNDSDDFIDLRKKDFKILLSSKKLKKIYVRHIHNVEQFEKFVKRKHKQLEISYSGW